MESSEESEAVRKAAEKKGINPDFLLAILKTYHDNVARGKKLQATQAIEAIIEEEVGRRSGR